MLLAKSTDGGNTFSAPVKVSDYYDLPDCLTYQGEDPGRACVPEKGETHNSVFRATNYPSGAVNPENRREIVVTLGSYINRHSNEQNGCVPQGFNADTFQALYDGVKTPGACNNDIVISRSTNAGQTFTGGSTNVRQLPATRAGDASRADQFWQWAAFDARGRLAVSYYDRDYGDDETTGFSDISLSGSRNGSDFDTTRVTSSSMPPPTQFEGQFFGDYSGLSAARRGASVLDGHARSGPVRLSRLGRQRDAAAECLHGGLRPRRGGQRSEHLHPGAGHPAALSRDREKGEGRAARASPYHLTRLRAGECGSALGLGRRRLSACRCGSRRAPTEARAQEHGSVDRQGSALPGPRTRPPCAPPAIRDNSPPCQGRPHGRFRKVFRGVTVDRCGGFWVSGTGSAGSHAAACAGHCGSVRPSSHVYASVVGIFAPWEASSVVRCRARLPELSKEMYVEG